MQSLMVTTTSSLTKDFFSNQGPEGGLGLYREENEFIKKRMINGLIRFFWTSGRKCNFDGCDREDLQPAIVNGKNLS